MDFRYVDSSLSAAAAQNGGATGSAGAGGSNGHSDHTLNVNIAPAHRGSADFGRLHSPITLASMMGTVPRSPYAQPLPAPDGATGPGDRKRQTQSCDRCRAKKRRCDCAFPTCSNCLKAGAECTMLLEQKKRGPKRASGAAPSRSSNKRNNSLYDVPSPVPANRGLPVLAPEPRESSVAASEEDAPMNDPADLFQSDSFFEIRGSNVIGSFSGDESIRPQQPHRFWTGAGSADQDAVAFERHYPGRLIFSINPDYCWGK
ncbi:hypothetical protein DFJ73DRAFT_428042 [Zopfochytrium polystomum]|nr:hypothetical protein DFJ73DRAFT_428042 [Zopfochytrium polystomum]